MKPLEASDPLTVGRYRVLAELGRGGMGRVFLANGPDGRLVALKIVHEYLLEDEDFRARFRREVDASRRVSGAYTAAVVDADPDARIPWLASVFVPGPTLRQAVDSIGVLADDPALRLAAGLASALMEIHRVGLVHRDLKPSNVLLTADGPRVIDFGVARAADGSGDTELTRTGLLVGSVGYMSPEQVLERPLTAASDVFSLGSVLTLACTGSDPFKGASTLGTLNQVANGQPDLTALSPGLRRIAERCLSKDPAARPTPAHLLEMVGRLAPSAQSWPDSVRRLITDQQSELDRILSSTGERATRLDAGRTAERTTRLDIGPTMADHTVLRPEPTRSPIVADTSTSSKQQGSDHSPRPIRRRSLIVGGLAAIGTAGIAVPLLMSDNDEPDDNAEPDAEPTPSTSPAEKYNWEPEQLAEDPDIPATGLAFSPNGTILATGGEGEVWLWDTSSTGWSSKLSHPDVRADRMAFSPGGDLLACNGILEVDVWDVDSGELVRILDADAEAVAFSPDGKFLVGGDSKQLRFWDVDSWEVTATLNTSGFIQAVAFSPDGATVATGGHGREDGDSRSSQVELWDTATGERIFAFDHPSLVGAVAFNPDGAILASGGIQANGTVLWDTTTGHQIAEFETLNGAGGLAFSPHGNFMAVGTDTNDGSGPGAAELWDVATGEQIDVLVHEGDFIQAVAFSPDGGILASSIGNSVILWHRS